MSDTTFIHPEKTELYLIKALSHLHAGSGESGYGAVDKMVQRDPLEGFPVIHASSMKGAFRELLEQYYPIKEVDGKKIDHPLLSYIFGSSIQATMGKDNEKNGRQAGSHRFHEAKLLSLPVRSNVRPFFRATSPDIAAQLLQRIEDMGIAVEERIQGALALLAKQNITKGSPQIFTGDTEVWLEEYEAVAGAGNGFGKEIEALFGENVALFHPDDLKDLAANLHVIARNHLENGISQNLWYEEVVPRETRFYFLLQKPKTDPQFELTEAHLAGPPSKGFAQVLSEVIQPAHHVQIGGNASVGYGLCHVSTL